MSQDNSERKRAAHFAPRAEEPSTEANAGAVAEPSAPSQDVDGAEAAQKAVAATPKRVRRAGSARSRRSRAASAKSSSHMSERTARATQRAAAAHQRRVGGTHPSAQKKGNNSSLPAVLALVAVALVVVLGFLVVPHLFQRGDSGKVEDYPAGETVYVTIPEGAGGTQIAQLLIEKHVLSSEQAFYQEVQKQNADARMKSGTYQFVTGGTASEVVRQLVEGPNATEFRLKLAEGLTVTQTAAQVEEQLHIKSDDFLEQAKASNYEDDYAFLKNASDDSLEGFLFGKTYYFAEGEVTADKVIRTMLDQYQLEMDSLDFDAARDKIRATYDIDITDYALLKVASIIEKEATTDEDRPLIASVFYNRIQEGMYLQSDATMMYVTGGEVTSEDLKTDSPYNTYLNPGTPPTPICSPSLASLQAALDPADTNYFYFFINENVHQFSETYEEHQQAISDSLNSGN